jgi:hypothetical protein
VALVQQVVQRLVVDLAVGHAQGERGGLGVGGQAGKGGAQGAREHARRGLGALDGVRLARGGDAVGHDRGVVGRVAEQVLHQRGRRARVVLVLLGGGVEDAGEGKGLAAVARAVGERGLGRGDGQGAAGAGVDAVPVLGVPPGGALGGAGPDAHEDLRAGSAVRGRARQAGSGGGGGGSWAPVTQLTAQ